MSEVAASPTTLRHWLSLTSAATAAVVVGFASTILVVMEGARAVGATPAQQASTAAILCFAMAITSFILAVRYKQPIMVAWSTPGSALMATGAAGIAFPEAIGAFMFAGALMMLTALIKPLSTAINRMPPSIAAAMLAGVLLRFVLGVPNAALALPQFVVPLVIAFFALRMLMPMFTVPVIVGLGLLFAALGGSFSGPVHLGITPMTFDLPQWNWQVIVGLGVPLYLVTMASQNLPGFAVLKAHGYQPPVGPCLMVTGLGSLLTAPFGTHAVNMAAITAAMVAGPDAHPDHGQRWKMIFPYTVLYIIFGLAAGTFVSLLGAMPKPLVIAIAGLALFSPLMAGVSAMVKEPRDVESALVTFLVTASGITILGVGAAFWGLLTGLLVWAAKRAFARG
jgi:benzoate membrane transport protein